jgi:hypothetical protein
MEQRCKSRTAETSPARADAPRGGLHATCYAAMKHSAVRAIVSACVAAGLLVAVPAGPAAAKSVQKREQKQEHRIQRGAKKGELTHKEAARLQSEQDRIAQERAADMADGKLSHDERRELKHDQQHASKQIHQQRHDDQERGH